MAEPKAVSERAGAGVDRAEAVRVVEEEAPANDVQENDKAVEAAESAELGPREADRAELGRGGRGGDCACWFLAHSGAPSDEEMVGPESMLAAPAALGGSKNTASCNGLQ